MNKLYLPSDLPSSKEKRSMWNEIESALPNNEKVKNGTLHWRSFWIGNAAALLIGFALIGIFSTGKLLLESKKGANSQEKVYETLTAATDQLKNLPPLLIDQASEFNKSSLKSTTIAIEEIDQLIEEIKLDMAINGETPAKRTSLKQLYATKLDFYKDLLLNEDTQS